MIGIFYGIFDWVEIVLNLIEAIAIIISIITFFYLMFNRFSVGMRKILSPLGLGWFNRIKVLFICRKSQNKKRFFIEYALLKTQGVPLIGKEWKYLISSFKSFYSEKEEETIYTAKNVSALNNASFSQAVQRYFDYFNLPKVKRAFGIEDNLSFIMQIKIEEVYFMPTCLLNGLLTFFDENWEEFIKQYVSTAYSEDSEHVHKLMSDELFYTFNWLLWGPSYEIEYRNGLWGGLCQMSYGDESISIPAIADTTKTTLEEGKDTSVAIRLRDKFIEGENKKDGRYGFLASAYVRIYDEIPFYKTFEKEINPHNAYFYEKIKKDELPYGIKVEDFSPITNYKTHKYYATAYVWVLFIEEADEHDPFKPEKCVAFYEHTNIADNQTYNFLVDSVIRKSLFHFKRIYESGEYKERKYRFLLAMNDRIADKLKEKYMLEMSKDTDFARHLKSHISFETKFTPTTIFQGFDEFFKPSKETNVTEVSVKDKKSLSYLGEFYTDIYIDVFKDKDERETFDNLLDYLSLSDKNEGKDYIYHIILVKDESGKVLGGSVFDYFVASNSAVIEFLAVREEKQSAGYGTLIYNEVLKILNRDANKYNHPQVDDIIIEINNPEYVEKGDPMKYLYFWNKLRYRRIEFDYVQPPLDEDKKEVRYLWLAHTSPKYQSEHHDYPYQDEINKETLFPILKDFFKYAFKIDNPVASPQYIEMYESVKKDKIKVTPIIK